MTKQIDVFISYKREERALTTPILRALRDAGYTAVTDINIAKNQEFGDSIDTMIRSAKVTLVLWTHASAQSDWVRKEARDDATAQVAALTPDPAPEPTPDYSCTTKAGEDGAQITPDLCVPLTTTELSVLDNDHGAVLKKITCLAPLANLPNLQVLDLRGTQITDLSPLAALEQLDLLYDRNGEYHYGQTKVQAAIAASSR